LIVNPSSETRAVLRAALELRGHEVHEAAASDQAVTLAQRLRPDLVVLDLEAEAHEPQAAARRFAIPNGEPTALVFLGRARRAEAAPPQAAFVAKPYHYPPLLSTIEDLLATRRAA